MVKYRKFIFASLAILLLAAGCTKTQPVDDTNLEGSPLLKEQSGQRPATSTSAAPVTAPKTQNPNAVVTQKTIAPPMNEIKYQGEDGKNAMDLLKAKYKVETKSFGSAGEFVESINGVKPDSKHFWKFFINGKSASVGASSYVTKSTDMLEWQLDEIK
ncbi:MAG: DUF4430 domain-containing protein [Candidatus Doudnabacteria bacterium]|nr:DUF4430 domain-containing protein [Candidatus Doudnabacteria bacterium]